MNTTAAMPVSVLHTTETLRGGIASYLDDVLPAQVERYGYGNVSILVGASQLRELKNLHGVVIHTHTDNAGRLANTRALGRKLRKLVAEFSYDLVHAHSTFAGIAMRVRLGFMRKRPRLVYCAHGWAFDRQAPRWQQGIARQMERMLGVFTDATVCISEHELQRALAIGLRRDRLFLVRNGIALAADTQAPKPAWPEDCVKVLFAGRFDKQKGVDIFSRALAALGSGWHGFAIGTPVIDHTHAMQFPACVTPCGWLPRSEVQQYLRTCDVVVIPSRWEGFGLIAVEAMRASRPVIASAVGGLTEIVVDGVTGRLVRPDSAEELENALRSLNTAELAAMGRAGHQRFLEHYTAERMNRELFHLYEHLSLHKR